MRGHGAVCSSVHLQIADASGVVPRMTREGSHYFLQFCTGFTVCLIARFIGSWVLHLMGLFFLLCVTRDGHPRARQRSHAARHALLWYTRTHVINRATGRRDAVRTCRDCGLRAQPLVPWPDVNVDGGTGCRAGPRSRCRHLLHDVI